MAWKIFRLRQWKSFMFSVFRCCNQWKKAKIVAFHMVTAFTALCWSFMHKQVCFSFLVAKLFKFDNTCKYPSIHGTIGLPLRIIWLIFTFVWILKDYWFSFSPGQLYHYVFFREVEHIAWNWLADEFSYDLSTPHGEYENKAQLMWKTQFWSTFSAKSFAKIC